MISFPLHSTPLFHSSLMVLYAIFTLHSCVICSNTLNIFMNPIIFYVLLSFLVFFLISFAVYVIPQFLISFLPVQNLKQRYGTSWACITGGSSGIGKCFATALAKQGFNLILISNSIEKLTETRNDLLRRFYSRPLFKALYLIRFNQIKIKIYSADFSDANTIRVQNILTQISSLDISVLILDAGYGAFEV